MQRRDWIVLSMAAVCAIGGAVVGARAESAREILDTAGVQGGLVVHGGCADGKVTAALGAGEGFLVLESYKWAVLTFPVERITVGDVDFNATALVRHR